MSILRDNLNVLLELQQVDSDRDKLARQRAGLDDGQQLTKEITAATGDFDKRRSELSATNGSLKDAELELAGVEKKIKDYEQKMRTGSVTNTREVMNFEKEFNQLNRQRAALDDKILTLMELSETQSSVLKASEQKVANLERDLATLKTTFHGALTKIEAQIGRLNQRRSELSKMVSDPVLLKKYETLRARPANAGVAISHAKDNTCGACHMQIGTIAVSQSAGGDQLSICENCGRILA